MKEFKSPDKWYKRGNFDQTKKPTSPSPKKPTYEQLAKTKPEKHKYCTYIHPITEKRCKIKLGLYPEFCELHTMLIDNVYINKSNIQSAGNGLFAGPHGFEKGDVIGKYNNPKNSVSIETLKKRCKHDSCWDYVFCNKNDCWDGKDIRSTITRNINDAHGSKYRNNAYFNVINNNVYIIASRNIKPNTEIFVSYGKHYWNK